MRIKPVRSISRLAYPPRQAVLIEPELLSRIPLRWQRCRKVAAASALTASIIMVAGCASPSRSAFFAHGDGVVGFACISLVPPVILSEDDAREVIDSVAKEYGVKFSSGKDLDDVGIPVPENGSGYPPPRPVRQVRSGTLELDGYDSKLDIGYEYVSSRDVSDWGVHTATVSSTTYDIFGTAQRLSESLRGRKTYTAVFYDPCAPGDPQLMEKLNLHTSQQDKQAYIDDAMEDSRALLRQQVKDFLDWLKSEGII